MMLDLEESPDRLDRRWVSVFSSVQYFIVPFGKFSLQQSTDKSISIFADIHNNNNT